MAFISNEKREDLIKKVNKGYGFRKFILLLDIILLTGFMIVAFLSWYWQGDWAWAKDGALTPFGQGMLGVAAFIVVLGLVSVILLFTIKSPRSVKEEIKTLESSPLAGKKIHKDETAGEVMRARRDPENAITESKKKKQEKKKKSN